MRKQIDWTPDLDAALRSHRMAGETWDAVAQLMGLSRNTVLECARKIGARLKKAPMPETPAEAAPRENREAMRPGDPISWGAINAGLLIAGEPYEPATGFASVRGRCCWPLGEPCTPFFHFCDAQTVEGFPYCATHKRDAYMRSRQHRSLAA